MTTQTQTEVHWRGQSGTLYTYAVFALDTQWYDVPGNYIFAKLGTNGRWSPIYVGETGSLKSRLTSSHEKLPCARMHGITHIHARVNNGGQSARLSEETDLRNALNPPCNLE